MSYITISTDTKSTPGSSYTTYKSTDNNYFTKTDNNYFTKTDNHATPYTANISHTKSSISDIYYTSNIIK